MMDCEKLHDTIEHTQIQIQVWYKKVTNIQHINKGQKYTNWASIKKFILIVDVIN